MASCTKRTRRAGSGEGSLHIDLRHVTRRVDGRRLVDGITLALEPGRVLMVCGPNGSGKSTLLKIIAGLTPPTYGDITFSGRSTAKWGPPLRADIGVLMHESLLYDELTVLDNLVFAARLYGVDRPGERAREMVRRMGLSLVAGEPARRLSRGMSQRLSIGRALIHDPRVLLLDEPYAGLDARWARELTRLLHERRAAETTVVLIVHEWRQAWPVADEVAVLLRGRLAMRRPTDGFDPDAFAAAYDELVIPGETSAGAET